MRRRLAATWLLLAAAGPAVAAPQSSAKPPAPYMDLQPIGFPAVVHGRLVNYVFADLRLQLGKGVEAAPLANEEPFLRDALVRAASRTPFNPPQDGVHLDEARLRAEVMRDAATLLGPGKVVGVIVKSQTPQRRTGVPGGATPDRPAS